MNLGDRNKQYIDVRTPGEFKGRSINGFKNIPLNQLPAKVSSLAKDKEISCYLSKWNEK